MKVYGPYLREDGRKHVILIHDDGTRKTKSYPKFLLEQKLNRELGSDETCDHIDEDFSNDELDNLQVLTRLDNIKKHTLTIPPAETHTFICPVCRDEATRILSEIRHNLNLGKSGPYCSRKCAGLVGKDILRIRVTSYFDEGTQSVIEESECWEIK